MAETNIEWADFTFNPWEGCTKVGPGCDHCYAETRNKRFHGGNWGPGAPRRRTSVANWKLPIKWNREAAKTGIRFRVFCASLADVFDNEVDQLWREDLWTLIEATPNLDWLLLTKRIGNVPDMVPSYWMNGEWPSHAWLGATVVNQLEADRDIPKLISTPAHIRFLSMEPLLGHVDLTKIEITQSPGYFGDCLQWYHRPHGERETKWRGIDWVIVGGESGTGARPMHPEWTRSLRDQCVAAGVKFHFKQWGAWRPESSAGYWTGPKTKIYPQRGVAMLRDGRIACEQLSAAEILQRAAKGERPIGTVVRDESALAAFRAQWKTDGPDVGYQWMFNVGKKESGRILDGRTWNEFPRGAA